MKQITQSDTIGSGGIHKYQSSGRKSGQSGFSVNTSNRNSRTESSEPIQPKKRTKKGDPAKQLEIDLIEDEGEEIKSRGIPESSKNQRRLMKNGQKKQKKMLESSDDAYSPDLSSCQIEN